MALTETARTPQAYLQSLSALARESRSRSGSRRCCRSC